MTVTERAELLVQQHGEVCTKAEAGRILSCGYKKICRMIADGRIDEACAGTQVDVRSIARYISQPRQEDFEARKRRMQLKYNSEFAV